MMSSQPNCPDQAALDRLLEGSLAPEREADLNRHLETCADCRSRLDQLSAGSDAADRAARALAVATLPRDDALAAVIERFKALAPAALSQPTAPALEPSEAGDPPNAADLYRGRLGHYETLQEIGRGGMGVVLKAFDPSLRRVVAIKVLASHWASQPAARRRFVREAQAAAAVCHDHVITLHAVEAENDPPFIVMQLIEGRSLQQRIDETGPLRLHEILRIGMQTAAGLAAAHAQGLVHRDIKPANILLENGVERVKITDFGLARAIDDVGVTESGIVAGTPQYMAPEQASGEVVDHRADLFSLGSVLYAMATGRPPFRGGSAVGVLKRVCEDAPPPIRELNPDIPGWLDEIIAKLLAKRPADRFASASDVAAIFGPRLAELQGSAPGAADGAGTPIASSLTMTVAAPDRHAAVDPFHSRSRLWSRRWAVVAAAFALLVFGLGVTEATGVTQVASTVIHVVTGAGKLVIEVDDPSISVLVDGEEIAITGAGPKEIRVRPGAHQVVAAKDGQPIRTIPVTISRGDRQLVRISVENDGIPALRTYPGWEAATRRDPAKAGEPRTATSSAKPGSDQRDYARLAPYSAIRWEGETPHVQIGDAWLELAGIDDLMSTDIVAFCKETYGDRWKKRFEEDLVEVLSRMGRPPRTEVDLLVRRPGAAEFMSLRNQRMTEENRRKIWQANVDRERRSGTAPPQARQ